MALCLTRSIFDNPERRTPYQNEKIESFLESCRYEIREDDAEELEYRIERFLEKNHCDRQELYQNLFRKAWNPQTGHIVGWLLNRMDERTIRRSLEEAVREMKKMNQRSMDFDCFTEEGDDVEYTDDECCSPFEPEGYTDHKETDSNYDKGPEPEEENDCWDEFQKLWEE